MIRRGLLSPRWPFSARSRRRYDITVTSAFATRLRCRDPGRAGVRGRLETGLSGKRWPTAGAGATG